MDDRPDEILRRLDALERKMDELARSGGAAGREAVCSFRSDERRIVDLIVHLVAERLERGHHPPPGPPPPPHGHGHPHGHHHGPHGHGHPHGHHHGPHGHGGPPHRW